MAESRPFTFTTPKRDKRFMKAFFFGPYGSGKTYLAGTAEDYEPYRDVLFIDAESGDLTLEDRWPNMTVVRITNFRQLARVHEFLTLHHRVRGENDEKKLLALENMYWPEPVAKPHHFNTVVIDSLSEVQGFLHYDILGVKLGITKLDEDLPKAGWDEFDLSINKMRYVVRSFRDLPMNVILVAGEQEKSDESRIRISANFQGKLNNELPGFMDLAGRLVAGEPDEKGVVHRRLYLSNGKNFKAKSRLSAIKAPWLDDPTMEMIAKASSKVSAAAARA